MWHVQAHTAHVTCEQHSELCTHLPSLLALTLHPAHCTHCTHPSLFRPPSTPPLPACLPACLPAAGLSTGAAAGPSHAPQLATPSSQASEGGGGAKGPGMPGFLGGVQMIDSSEITLGRMIGSGAYGKVGRAGGLPPS